MTENIANDYKKYIIKRWYINNNDFSEMQRINARYTLSIT